MSADPRLVVTASLLAQGRTLHLTTLALALGVWVVTGAAVLPSLVALALLGAGTWLAARVGVDAALFDALANGLSPDDLDVALVATGLVEERGPRSLADRIAGALRLWRLQLTVVVLQGALLALSTVVW